MSDEYKENLLDFERLEIENVNINNILIKKDLEMIDKLLLSIITGEWQKTALIVGQAYIYLQNHNKIQLFGINSSQADILLAQRMLHLLNEKKIKVNGNIKAIRFSEVCSNTI